MSAILFAMQDVYSSLTVMWQGMLTIFIVMCLISLIVSLSVRSGSKKKSDE